MILGKKIKIPNDEQVCVVFHGLKKRRQVAQNCKNLQRPSSKDV